MGKGLEYTFLKIRHTNSQQAHEKILTIREMQIETPLSYHLTPIEMTTLKKTINNKCWLKCEQTGTLIHH